MRGIGIGAMCVLVGLCAGCGAPKGEAVPPLKRGKLQLLLARAASCPFEPLQTMVELGAKATLADVDIPGVGTPVTAVIGVLPFDGPILEEDFKINRKIMPSEFADAIVPHEIRAGRREPKYAYASLIHPEYVRELEYRVDGGAAKGKVSFRVPDRYEGTMAFEARYAAGAWNIVMLAFEKSGIRWTLEDGLWKLHMPDADDAPADDDLELPRVTQVGRAPQTESITIRLTAGGDLHATGTRRNLTIAGLRRHLARHLKDRGDAAREPDGAAGIAAVLEIDAKVPWELVQLIMQACAHPDVKMYKIFFRARAGQDTGAIATFLPKDNGIGLSVEPVVKHKIKLFKSDSGPTDLRALWAALLRLPETERNTAIFEIVAPPPKGGAVPTGYVLAATDLALRAGANEIIFEGAASRHEDLDDETFLPRRIRELGERPGTAFVKLNRMRLEPDAETAPALPPTSRVEGIVGSTRISGLGVFEALEETEEPLDEGVRPDEIEIRPAQDRSFRGRRAQPENSLRKRAAEAVDQGLRWLAAHQSPNGSWEAAGFNRWCDAVPIGDPAKRPEGLGKAMYDPGVTGLALCAFLGAGYTNRGRHPYAKVVSKGLRHLKNVQDPEGCFGPRSHMQYVYSHALCALAMVEAYGMTGSPIFKGSAQRALDFVVITRNPHSAWRYGVKPGDSDTSVTSWMTTVLKSAMVVNADALRRGRRAPLRIDETAFDGIGKWLDKVVDGQTGRAGYITRGAGPSRPRDRMDRFPAEKSESLTAAAVFMRIVTGNDPRRSDVIKKGVALVAQRLPRWDPADGSIDMYYWYYGTLAMYQVGGRSWSAWEQALDDAVLATQRRDTEWCMYKGSWDPVGMWGVDGGRVYSTAMMTLCLEAWYRYRRVFGG